MFRVITDVRDHRGKRILETGPWLKSKSEAEFWAGFLRSIGYHVRVEELDGQVGNHPH